MADCCNELRKELAAIKAELQQLNGKFIRKEEKPNIIQDAIRGMLKHPEFLLVGATAFGANDLAQFLTKVKVPQISGQALEAQRKALEAAFRAGDAINRLNDLGGKVAKNTSLIGDLLSKFNGLVGRVNQLFQSFGQLLSRLQPLFALLGVVGLLLSLAQLAGTLTVIFPRLDAIDSRLASFESGLSKSIGLIQQAFSRATRALNRAEEANNQAGIATAKAEDAKDFASNANRIALKAEERSNKAISDASDAIASATDSIKKSEQATIKANRAIGVAETANGKAINAIEKANKAQLDANNANQEVIRLRGLIAELRAKFAELISGIDSRFGQLKGELSAQFRAQLQALEQRLARAESVANVASTKASTASTQAVEATQLATEAITESKQSVRSPEFSQFKQETKNVDQQLKADIQQVKNDTNRQIKLGENRITEINQTINVINQEGVKVDPETKQQLNRLTDQQNQLALALVTLTVVVKGLQAAQSSDLNQLKQNTSFNNLANAASTGNCRTTQPGGCSRRMIQEENNSLLDKINNASKQLDGPIQAAQLAMLTKLDNKMGNQLPGGISGKLQGMTRMISQTYKFLQIDRVLNVLTYWAALHNAMMLSNNVGQTLFSGVGNLLAVFGIGQIDSEGNVNPINVGAIVAGWTEAFFKQVFGAENYQGMKREWRRFSRIYQAAANIVWSVQSIGYSIINILEVMSSMNAKIGNALKSFGKVGERAYGWFNPQPNYQNRFFTAMERTEMVTSQLDSVTSEVLSTQQTINQISKLQEDLQKEVKQESGFKNGVGSPEALAQKAIEDQRKQASEGISLGVLDLIKPEN